MAQIITSLADVSDQYSAVFCDLWGCLHNGKTAYPAAVAALRDLRAKGVKVILVTNSPRPASSVRAQLERFNVPTDCWDAIASSGDAAQYALVTGAVGNTIYHIGAQKDLPFFTDFADDLAQTARSYPAITRVAKLEDASGVVCTGLADDQTETPQDYHVELLMAKTLGLTMLCANPDIVVDVGDKKQFCAGALARDFEEMGGTALYFGKPHPPIYDLAYRKLAQIDPDRPAKILCIGDGINTDIRGGIGEGLDTLFITGGIDSSAFGPVADTPDPQLLQAWLDEKQLNPTYAMGHLA